MHEPELQLIVWNQAEKSQKSSTPHFTTFTPESESPENDMKNLVRKLSWVENLSVWS